MAHRVLVVEDDARTRDVLARLLREEGFSVEACPDGEQALARVGREPFDVMLTDYKMGELTGLELVRRVKRAWPGVRCMIVSALPPPPDAGDVTWLSKPIDFYGLLACLE
jgi:CheY-like chemotaxis protein